VQGKGSAALIAKAIHKANERAECETLIICRGGGSMEDLWQFNEEVVARAIDDSAIPTISGVGHETDFTICDFVADVRAATPTAAAELASQDMQALQKQLHHLWCRLARRMDIGFQSYAQRLDYLSRRLISPLQQIENKKTQINGLARRMDIGLQSMLKTKSMRLINLQNSLAQLNPHNVLARGYALVTDKNGALITAAKQLKHGDEVDIQLIDGKVGASITTSYNP
jgi:exodeoxyribonuclease VII large subunit